MLRREPASFCKILCTVRRHIVLLPFHLVLGSVAISKRSVCSQCLRSMAQKICPPFPECFSFLCLPPLFICAYKIGHLRAWAVVFNDFDQVCPEGITAKRCDLPEISIPTVFWSAFRSFLMNYLFRKDF